jgi:hypothetical protein
VAYSLERLFDQNATMIRACQHLDFGVAPAAGVVITRGIA